MFYGQGLTYLGFFTPIQFLACFSKSRLTAATVSNSSITSAKSSVLLVAICFTIISLVRSYYENTFTLH